jgi:hypothetical protein
MSEGESELESLQCFPFHLPDTIPEPRRDRRLSYRPLEGHDCDWLGNDADAPCWGQVRDDFILTSLGGLVVRYYCQGHIKQKPWHYYPEDE